MARHHDQLSLASRTLDLPRRHALTDALTSAHHTAEGPAALAVGGVGRFVAVTSEDHAPLRRLARAADEVPLARSRSRGLRWTSAHAGARS